MIKYFLQATAVKDTLKIGVDAVGEFIAGMARSENFDSYITVQLIAYSSFLLG